MNVLFWRMEKLSGPWRTLFPSGQFVPEPQLHRVPPYHPHHCWLNPQNQQLHNHDHHPDCHIFGGEGNEKTDKKPLCPAGNLFTSLGIFSHKAGFQSTENTSLLLSRLLVHDSIVIAMLVVMKIKNYWAQLAIFSPAVCLGIFSHAAEFQGTELPSLTLVLTGAATITSGLLTLSFLLLDLRPCDPCPHPYDKQMTKTG